MTLAIRSMTGFGKSEFEIANSKFRIEIRSVNHRFLDLKIRLPREFQALEHPIRAVVQSHFNRGSLDIKLERSLSDQPIGNPQESSLEVNEKKAKEAIQAYKKIAQILGSEDRPSIKDIISFPEVLQSKGSNELNLDILWKETLETALLESLQDLKRMREVEGNALRNLLLESTKVLKSSLIAISARREQSQSEVRQKVSDRLQEVFQNFPFPSGMVATAVQPLLESRIAQEMALILDRIDIQEELDRFQGHLEHFDKTLLQGGPSGRKLEFILQELGRETNTLGNKAQDFKISEQVVSIKVRLEQLREQVLNLE